MEDESDAGDSRPSSISIVSFVTYEYQEVKSALRNGHLTWDRPHLSVDGLRVHPTLMDTLSAEIGDAYC